MSRVARVVLTDTDPETEIDPITLDLLLDEAGRVVKKAPTTGWWGGFGASSDLIPFILLPSGKLDFGSEYDVSERFGQTNVHSKTIALNEYVTVETDWGQHCLRVSKIAWLDELN